MNLNLFPFCLFMLRGTHTPGLAHSTPLRATDLLCFLLSVRARRVCGPQLAFSLRGLHIP